MVKFPPIALVTSKREVHELNSTKAEIYHRLLKMADLSILNIVQNSPDEVRLRIIMKTNFGSAAIKYNDLGLQKYLQVEFDDAIADYTRAIELDPNLAVAYFNRGTVYYRLGNYETALKDLIKCTNLEPTNPEFQEGLRDCQKMLEEEENIS